MRAFVRKSPDSPSSKGACIYLEEHAHRKRVRCPFRTQRAHAIFGLSKAHRDRSITAPSYIVASLL